MLETGHGGVLLCISSFNFNYFFLSFEIIIALFLPPNPPVYASSLFFKFMAFFVVTYIYVNINVCVCVFLHTEVQSDQSV